MTAPSLHFHQYRPPRRLDLTRACPVTGLHELGRYPVLMRTASGESEWICEPCFLWISGFLRVLAQHRAQRILRTAEPRFRVVAAVLPSLCGELALPPEPTGLWSRN